MFGTTATSASHIATAPATAHATTDPAATATAARPQTTPRHPSVASMGASLSTSTTVWALRISESVQWVARVNFAWIVLTLMGGVVFGFAPAAFATAAACRERLRTGHDARLLEFIGLWRRDVGHTPQPQPHVTPLCIGQGEWRTALPGKNARAIE